jgi:hypothetical protein
VYTTDEAESAENLTESDAEFEPPKPTSTTLKLKQRHSNATSQLFTSHVTSALDRNKISDREAVRLMVPITAALGCDPSSLPLSRSTIHRARKKARKDHAESAIDTFVPEYPLVLHWDRNSNILPEIFGNKKVDRLPVLVSGDGLDKLLGVPKLAAGTALNEAKAIYDLLQVWKLTDKVQAMSFDTTGVNTGRLGGVCVLLEKKIGRELMWLACRHHVMELILAKVFTLCFGPSSSPDIPIFKRFKTAWEGITCKNFRGLEIKEEAAIFCNSTVCSLGDVTRSESQIRDDYQELIELTMIVLGFPPAKIHWRAPGPVHHARWMAKLIYGIKIFLFRDQRDIFNLTKKEENQFHRFVQFGALLYTKVWTEAPLAAEAPSNDLALWIDLGKYQCIDREISLAAREVLERHLWYITDETVGLALFSNRVSAVEKAKIVAGMMNETGERNVRGEKSILNDFSSLGDFSTTRTKTMLTRLGIGDSFLTIPPDEWSENDDFLQGRERVHKLRVVNDTAERGVKLFEEFNKLITNDEQEKQFLLQVVEANRKAVPTEPTKKSVIDAVMTK